MRASGILRLNTIEPVAMSAVSALPPPNAAAAAAAAAAHAPANDKRALAVANALEQRTLHPVARAVVAAAAEVAAIPAVTVDSFRVIHGCGVEGVVTVAGEPRPLMARFGSVRFVAELCEPSESDVMRHRAHAGASPDVLSALVLAELPAEGAEGAAASSQQQRTTTLRLFTFSDSVRERSAAAVAEMRAASWQRPHSDPPRIMMLTGKLPPPARMRPASRLHAGPAAPPARPHCAACAGRTCRAAEARLHLPACPWLPVISCRHPLASAGVARGCLWRGARLCGSALRPMAALRAERLTLLLARLAQGTTSLRRERWQRAWA